MEEIPRNPFEKTHFQVAEFLLIHQNLFWREMNPQQANPLKKKTIPC